MSSSAENLPEAAVPTIELDSHNLSLITNSSSTTTANTTKTLANSSDDGKDNIDGLIWNVSAQDLVNNNGSPHINVEASIQPNGKMSPKKTTSEKKLGRSGSQQGKQKRNKINDLSKFNRSTRKSKNCATFYFKHLDTDSELNKDSSERTKSEASTSSSEGDDGWVYNNGSGGEEGGEASQDSSSDPARAMESSKLISLDEEDEKENNPVGEEMTDGTQQQHNLRSKKCLDFTHDAKLSSRALMMTSIGSFGKSTESVDSGGGRIGGGSLISSKVSGTDAGLLMCFFGCFAVNKLIVGLVGLKIKSGAGIVFDLKASSISAHSLVCLFAT